MLIQALNPIDEDHLVDVMGYVGRRKKPLVIHVVDNVTTLNVFNALEGSHRLEAACRLRRPICIQRIAPRSTFDARRFELVRLEDYLTENGVELDECTGTHIIGWLAWFFLKHGVDSMGCQYHWSPKTRLLRKAKNVAH